MTLKISPEEYARLIGHSSDYVRRYLMKGENPEKMLQIRIRASDVLEDIYDIAVKEDDPEGKL